MTDTEMLDLIQRYGWPVVPAPFGDGWMIKDPDWRKPALASGKTLRDTIRKAMVEQAKRSAKR